MANQSFSFKECNTTIRQSERLVRFKGWEVIPETILLNLVLFFFFLIIFIILRKLAWDRKHVNIRRTSKSWLQSIYGDRKLTSNSLINRQNSLIIHHKHDLQIDILLPPKVASGDMIEAAANGNNNISHNGNSDVHLNLALPEETSLNQSDSSVNDIGNNCDQLNQPPSNQSGGIFSTSFDFTSIPMNIQATFAGVGYKLSDVLLISNKDILDRRGNDALQYLLFQQYIIYFLIILSLFCMLVILPVNLKGNSAETKFGRTTILNLPGSDEGQEFFKYYYFHVVGASFVSLIGIYMMHAFSKVIKLDEEQITRRTLLIRRIPKSKRNKELLANYFRKSISNCVIEGIQSIYDVRGLTPLTNELTNLVNARCFCLEYLELEKKPLQIRPSTFGEFGCLCGCFKSCRKVDGIQYYIKQEEKLQQDISASLKNSVSNPTGGFFITFQTEKMAQAAFIHLRKKQERFCSFCPFSTTINQVYTWCAQICRPRQNDDLDVAHWMVSYAPYPDDINWCDITVNLRMRWFRGNLINLILLVVFVFFSTPSVIWTSISANPAIGSWLKNLVPIFGTGGQDIVGVFILVIAASALPAIVTLACQHIPYANNSAKNHAIMWKVYLFLLLMVIILPTLGITSIEIFLERFDKETIQWECILPVKVGSFFVNYTIQSAFLGNIMELIRLPELLIYMWYMAIARSRAEVDTASRYVVWDFSIGIRYPRFLLIFAMVVTYSMSCPLISVAGLVYMLIKHLVDRYNIYYVYNPSKINSKIHSTAIMFVHIALLMMQAQIFTVTLVRTGRSEVSGLALIVLVVSLLIFSGHFFFYLFRNINHLTFRATRKQSETRRDYCACAYLPPVLYNLTRYAMNKSPSTVNTGIGLGSNSGGALSGETGLSGESGVGSNQNLIVPVIDTSDAYFLLSGGVGGTMHKYSRHTTMLSTRKHQSKSRRTASDGQQQFHPSRLVKYEELQLKRTSSNVDNVM